MIAENLAIYENMAENLAIYENNCGKSGKLSEKS